MGSLLTPSPAWLSQDYHLSLPEPRPQDRTVINQRQKQKQAEKCNQLGKGRARQGCDNLLSRWDHWLTGPKRAGRGFPGGLQGQDPQLGPQQGQRVISSPISTYSPLCTQAHATPSPRSAPCPPPSLRLLPTSSCPPFPCQLTTRAHTGVQTLLTHAHGTCKHLYAPSWITDRGPHVLCPRTSTVSPRCAHVLGGPDRPSHQSLQDTWPPFRPSVPPGPGHRPWLLL